MVNKDIFVSLALNGKKLTDDFDVFIGKSKTISVLDKFNSANECLSVFSGRLKTMELPTKKKTVRLPHVLFLSLGFPIVPWTDFYIELHQLFDDKGYPPPKIIAVITYDEYVKHKQALNALTWGYISEYAWPKVIELAVYSVCGGHFFRHNKVETEETEKNDLFNTGNLQQMIQEEELKHDDSPAYEEEPDPEWLSPLLSSIISEATKNSKVKGDYKEMAENLSLIIHATEKTRLSLIKLLLSEGLSPAEEEDYLSQLIDHLLIKDESNWDIADKLNDANDEDFINKVRFRRLQLILRLTGKNTMMNQLEEKDEMIKLSHRDIQLLRLIAAGYSNDEIAVLLNRSVDTVKTNRRNLIDKFGMYYENTMSMVIKALRMGYITLEDVSGLLDDRIEQLKKNNTI